MSSEEKIAVLGAGAWGTALANVAATGRSGVALWGHDPAHVAALARDRENRAICPACRSPPASRPAPISRASRGASVVLGVVPAQAMREVARRLRAAFLRRDGVFVVCAKGIERGTRRFMSEVVGRGAAAGADRRSLRPELRRRRLPRPADRGDARRRATRRWRGGSASCCRRAAFRLYRSTDLRGVEIGGAAKNVLAIAAAWRRAGRSARAPGPR